MKFGKVLYILTVIVLLAIFAVSAIYVGNYFYEAKRQQSEYDELAALVESAKTPTENREPEPTVPDSRKDASGEEIPTEATEPTILPEYQSLYEMNPDIVGWIQIEGTKVNYPVMQTPDRVDYYLYRNFNGAYSSRGCIYIREECDVFAPSDNLTIYGHRMNDGSMFQCLGSYQKQSYWEENDTIIFDTIYEHHTYQIFAVFKTSAVVGKGFPYHMFVDAADEAEFDEFVAKCKELAFYDTGITPEYGDKLITLSTCEYSQAHGRLVVVAVRID